MMARKFVCTLTEDKDGVEDEGLEGGMVRKNVATRTSLKKKKKKTKKKKLAKTCNSQKPSL